MAFAYIGGSEAGIKPPGFVHWRWNHIYRCSGVKVSDHHVLTAGHCFDPVDVSSDPDFKADRKIDIASFLGLTDPDGITTDEIHIHVHPKWIDGQDPEHDLAVIEVKELSVGQVAKISFGSLVPGQKFVIGGFGCKGGWNNSTSLTTATKALLGFANGMMQFGFEDTNGVLSMACSGDSGGGVFYFNEATKSYEVVAINYGVNIDPKKIDQIIVDQPTGNVLGFEGSVAPKLHATPLLQNRDWLETILPWQ
jgi:hypothetical protein